MKKAILSIILFSMALGLVSCGSKNSASRDSGGYMAEDAMMDEPVEAGAYKSSEGFASGAANMSADMDFAEESADSEAPESVGEGEASGAKASKRKLITNVNLETESDDVEGFSKSIENRIQALGGYVESSNVYSGSGNYDNYYNNTSKSADITARIPAEKLQEFLKEVDGSSNIVRKSVNTRDVTLEYTDTEAHERALAAEQKSLEAMMEHAETIEDILSIQTQLTDVRYRLDSIRSQLRTYDNDITYATVYISVTETKKFTVTKEETAWERIRKGFVDNLIEVMDAVSDFIIYFLTHIPAFIMLGLIIFVFVMVIKRIRNTSRKKKEAKNRSAASGETVSFRENPAEVRTKGGIFPGKKPQQNEAPQQNADPDNSESSGDSDK